MLFSFNRTQTWLPGGWGEVEGPTMGLPMGWAARMASWRLTRWVKIMVTVFSNP